jgi:hypothetical protein
MKRVILVVAALAFSTAAGAQMYKWKDKNGHVRYGDTPPPGVEATSIQGPSAAPSPAPEAKTDKNGKAEKPLTPEQAFQKRQKERAAADEKAAKERADAAVRQANCEQARGALRNLESGQRISSINAAGERVFADDAERASMTARAEKAVAEWCN